MKVIFLDFDGVLNSEEYSRLRNIMGAKDSGSFMHRSSGQVDPVAVARLNRIVESTGAAVCISSTWRRLHIIGELNAILRERGFAGRVVGATPWLNKPRGLEIQDWLDLEGQRHDVEAFVILDDDADMEHLMDHLVQTNGAAGLEDHHVERAIAMLGRLG